MLYSVGFHEIRTNYFLPSTFLFFLLGHVAQSARERWQILKAPPVGYGLLASSVAALLIGPYTQWEPPMPD